MKWATRKPESEVDWKERIVRHAIGFAVLLVVYLLLVLIYVYPHWPIDLIGWGILILVGIPVSFCLELIGGNIFSRQVGQRVSSKGFSVKRIAIVLLIILGVAGAFFFFWTACEPFVRPHFK